MFLGHVQLYFLESLWLCPRFIMSLFLDYWFQPKLKVVDKETMEKEYNTLLSEKVGETEYLKSLQEQVERLKVSEQLLYSEFLHIIADNFFIFF